MTNNTRRNLLKNSLLSIGAISIASKSALATSCGLTPAQTEGPFYPIQDQLDKDSDLTFVNSRFLRAQGEVIILKGIVIGSECSPVENALVEIWQACASGKYNHPGDPNPAKLDPNFQYWGRAITNSKGEYSFRTIIPGQYQATSTWMRPSHIHFKVHKRGYEELTSQLYFKGDRFNADDRILQSLSQSDQKNVIVDFIKLDDGPRVGHFNITIKEI